MFEDTKYKNILDILGILVIVLLAVQLFLNNKKTTAIQNSKLPAIQQNEVISKNIQSNEYPMTKQDEVIGKDIQSQKFPTIQQEEKRNKNIQNHDFPVMQQDEVIRNFSKYKKVKATDEQIQHQKKINELRKSKGLPEFPVRDYVYVKDNYNAPIGTTLSGTQEKNVKNVNSIKQEKQITATSRMLTGNELELSNIRSSYVNYMAYSVRSNWKNPTGNNNYSLGLTFNIDKDGRITAYDILHSSESVAFDKAAIQCLLYTAPFKPIPAELQMDGLNAQIYFNGVEVQVGGISKLKPTYRLTYDVDQTNKTCKTIEINQAKRLRTQSMLPTSAPTDLHWELGRQIQHSWNPPLNANSSVCLKFRVLRTGAVQNIQFEKKSYNDTADMAAYNSIKNLKLSQFPLTSKNMYIDVKYWFYVENNK